MEAEEQMGASLVVQWLRIRLSMQGTRIRSLLQEYPTCCGAAEPLQHNYWAHALEPVLCNEKPPQWEALHSNKE